MPVTHGVAGSSPVPTAKIKSSVYQSFFCEPYFAMYFVYILYSESAKVYYKGFTENVNARLEEHNADKSRFTKNKGPWQLIFVQRFSTKREALIREKSLKKCKPEYFHWLSTQEINVVHEFI